MGEASAFRQAAKSVSNWGRWGYQDEIGTLNFITPNVVKRAISSVKDGTTYSLGIELGPDGPQSGPKGKISPFRANPQHFMVVDGGDESLLSGMADGLGNSVAVAVQRAGEDSLFRFNDDYIMMPLQAATQWDSLAHVYYDRKLYNGFDATTVTSFGAARNSIGRVAERGGVVSRGVLLDIARHRGVQCIEGGEPILPDELDEVANAEHVSIQRGDVVIIRTGWMGHFLEHRDGDFHGNGLSWRCAAWLHDHEVAAVAADNRAVEASHVRSVPETRLPLHLLAQRDMGMMFGELFHLEELATVCAADGRFDFCLAAPALNVVGGVGSPINPVAIRLMR